jgi:hypothetical protein
MGRRSVTESSLSVPSLNPLSLLLLSVRSEAMQIPLALDQADTRWAAGPPRHLDPRSVLPSTATTSKGVHWGMCGAMDLVQSAKPVASASGERSEKTRAKVSALGVERGTSRNWENHSRFTTA